MTSLSERAAQLSPQGREALAPKMSRQACKCRRGSP